MAGSLRIKLNTKGIQALLSSTEVRRDLDRRARAIRDEAAQTAGEDAYDGFHVTHTQMRDRAAVRVVAGSIEARIAEAQDGVLTRAIDAGRG